MVIITEFDDCRIEQFKSLKTIANQQNKNNFFIADSQKVVLKLLESDIELISVLTIKEFYDVHSEIIQSKLVDQNKILIASHQLMNQIVGFKLHKGVMALARIPELSALNCLNNSIVVLNSIINSENVGSIIRNANAFGFDSLIFDNSTSHPYLRRSVRVSMGNIFDLKIHKSINLIETLSILKNDGYKVVAAEINSLSIPINDYHPTEKTVLIFGNESHGIENKILNLCDQIIHIPINKNTESINVAASSAIFFYYLKKFK